MYSDLRLTVTELIKELMKPVWKSGRLTREVSCGVTTRGWATRGQLGVVDPQMFVIFVILNTVCCGLCRLSRRLHRRFVTV